MNFSMNSVTIMGRLTRDPELSRFESKGETVAACKFTVAVDRKFAKKTASGYERETDFIPVKLFRRDAENASKHLRKGSQVIISGGELNINNVEQADGTKRQFIDVVAGNLILPAAAKNSVGASPQTRVSAPNDFGAEIGDDDVPF